MIVDLIKESEYNKIQNRRSLGRIKIYDKALFWHWDKFSKNPWIWHENQCKFTIYWQNIV